jgi:spore coat-associated protein N
MRGDIGMKSFMLAEEAKSTRSHEHKLILSLALLMFSVGIVGVGAFATFTSSAGVSHTISSGTVTITLGATGASTNRLNIDASGIVPGDTIQRSVNLIDSGNQDLASITLTTVASPTSLLDTDATNGLQMTVDRCSVAWTEAGTAPAYTYTCAGSSSVVLAARPLIGSNIALSNLGALTAGTTDLLRVTLSLPVTAGNTFQGLTSTVTYTFTGTQRAGTNK